METSADWSTLPSDLVNRVADCLLVTNDVDHYMDLRAVCGAWRSATAETMNSPDKRFRPRWWVVIDEFSYSFDAQCRTRLLVNTATGRVLRVDLPMLHRYHVVTTTAGGFFILADRQPPHAVCVLNPFTGHLVHFNAPLVPEVVNAAAIDYTGDAPTLFLFCDSSHKLYGVEADWECFDVLEDKEHSYPFIRLSVLGVVYTGVDVYTTGLDVTLKMMDLLGTYKVHPSWMLGVYPCETNRCFLVGSADEMLIIFKLEHGMDVFRMNIHRGVFEPVKSIGNRAIFLGYRQCLCVEADKFPSVDANCIYYQKSLHPCDIYMYDLKAKKEERVSGGIETVNSVVLFHAEPPFTIIQLLSSYTINAFAFDVHDSGCTKPEQTMI